MAEVSPMKQVPITLGDVTEKIIEQVKVLNAHTFPVQYNADFYSRLVANPEFCKLAYYSIDTLVGGVSWKLEKRADGPGTRLYIMTLGVLVPYRRLGIGTKLLNWVFDYAKRKPEIDEIYLHVQINNEAALNFYKKFGFEVAETIQGYYKKIEPSDCYLLTKSLK